MTITKEKSAKKASDCFISRRKKEYKLREDENKEIIVNSFGSFVGLTQKGVTIRQNGKIIYQHPASSLDHITILGKGITLTTYLIEYCLTNNIPIDFFSHGGRHSGSIMSNSIIENALWAAQAHMNQENRNFLALRILTSKMKNQLYLVKYFHKYHKNSKKEVYEAYSEMEAFFKEFKVKIKVHDMKNDDFINRILAQEAQCALKYWKYIRALISDHHIAFECRKRKGATDLVNCMLNYGYAILYSRVWQALLKAKLNPYDSIIHVKQPGKPTFVYDVVEIFRSQVVDRVVVSLIHKKHNLCIIDGLLDEKTKGLVAKAVIDRLNRYEYYRGERITMEEIINRQAKEIAHYFAGLKEFKPYISKW